MWDTHLLLADLFCNVVLGDQCPIEDQNNITKQVNKTKTT